jgi:hypothetical protein
MHFNVADAERGLELFPDDPEMLFFEACLHETLASPAIQEPLRKSETFDGRAALARPGASSTPRSVCCGVR